MLGLHPSIGQPISALDTPALLVDLDFFEHNIAKGYAALSRTVGICVAKLGEAELIASADCSSKNRPPRCFRML